MKWNNEFMIVVCIAFYNQLLFLLYQALFPTLSSGNLIFSPFSLHAVLGMVGQGARGETRSELLKGLKFSETNDEVIAKSYNSVITGFQVLKYTDYRLYACIQMYT